MEAIHDVIVLAEEIRCSGDVVYIKQIRLQCIHDT